MGDAMHIKKHYRMITISLPVEYHTELVKLKKKYKISLQDLTILAISLFVENKDHKQLFFGGVKMPDLKEKLEKLAVEPTPQEKKEIEKFREGVQKSTEKAENERWGPAESAKVPIDLAKMGAEQAKTYRDFQEKIAGFSDSVVISELAGLKTDVNQSMLKFAQLEQKFNEIEADEDLSPTGKSKRLKDIQEIKSGISDELNSAMTKIEAFQEIAEQQGYRQESLSENEFSMLPGDHGSKSNYALYSEMKLARLHNEFSNFGSTQEYDNKHLKPAGKENRLRLVE
jgi:hypothetical protein